LRFNTVGAAFLPLSATGFAFFVDGFLAAGIALAKSFFNCLAAA